MIEIKYVYNKKVQTEHALQFRQLFRRFFSSKYIYNTMIEKLNINKTDMILRTIVKFLKVILVIFCDFDFNIQEIRQITQLQYTSWPDHDSPSPLELLEYYRYVSNAMQHHPEQKLLVHCRFNFFFWIYITKRTDMHFFLCYLICFKKWFVWIFWKCGYVKAVRG